MKRFAAFLACACAVSAAAAEFDAARATNGVGLELFRALAPESARNLVISPYSIESALVLAHAGAADTTRAEMARVLQLPEDEAAVQRGFIALRTARPPQKGVSFPSG